MRKAQSIVEYGLILLLIACASFILLDSLGQQTKDVYSGTSKSIQLALKQSEDLLNSAFARLPATIDPKGASSPVASTSLYSDDNYASTNGIPAGVSVPSSSPPSLPSGSSTNHIESPRSGGSNDTQAAPENRSSTGGSDEYSYTVGNNSKVANKDSSLSKKVGQDIYVNSDGSITMEINGQKLEFPKKLLDTYEMAVETSGTYGKMLEDMLAKVSKMVEQHKDEYPSGQVPVDIKFGEYMERASHGITYNGDSQISFIYISIGTHAKITATLKEQSADNTSPEPVECANGSCVVCYDLLQGSAHTVFNGDVKSQGSKQWINLTYDQVRNTLKGTYRLEKGTEIENRDVTLSLYSNPNYNFRL